VQLRADDPDLAFKLSVRGQPVELVDETGRVLGVYTPAPIDPAALGPDLSEEEYQRRLSDPRPGYTGEQVLARLRSLKCSS
jgi:hypothetical protein